MIRCCKECVPPKRHIGCHETCKKYLEEKAEFEKEKEWIRQNKYEAHLNFRRNRADYTNISLIDVKQNRFH